MARLAPMGVMKRSLGTEGCRLSNHLYNSERSRSLALLVQRTRYASSYADIGTRVRVELSQRIAEPSWIAFHFGGARRGRNTTGGRATPCVSAPPSRTQGARRRRTSSRSAHHWLRSGGERCRPYPRQTGHAGTGDGATAAGLRQAPRIRYRTLPPRCRQRPSAGRGRVVRRELPYGERAADRKLSAPRAALSLCRLVRFGGSRARPLWTLRRRRSGRAD